MEPCASCTVLQSLCRHTHAVCGACTMSALVHACQLQRLTSWPWTVFNAFPSNEACLTLSLTCTRHRTPSHGLLAVNHPYYPISQQS